MVEYIGIPLGNQHSKEKLPPLSYFLFYGPEGSGKTLMIRALAYETNAMVVDLSKDYLEKNSGELLKVMYMAFTVAKEFQPAIIFFDEMEQLFPGKGAGKKKKSTGLAKVKKILFDMKKSPRLDKQMDRVVVIGCTNKPWEGSSADFKKFFDKKIYFPFPNYATRLKIFSDLIKKKGVHLPNNFPLSTLAYITEGYTPRSVRTLFCPTY